MSDVTIEQVLIQRKTAIKDIVNVDEQMVKLVIFELAGRHFAFNGEHIREILSGIDVFFVPGCPSSLEGVMNVRGDIESVIRLNEMLNLPVENTDKHEKSPLILLGRGAGISSGIRVDSVVDVIDVTHSSLQPPPANVSDHIRAISIGVLMFKGLPVTLLDLDRIFADYAKGLG